MRRYSRQGLWTLFLVCAFPFHLWTIILAFRDFSWVAERTNAWDAIGVAAYGMLFALFEGLVVFLVAVLLGFLIPRIWNEKRIALLSVLVLVTAFWAIVGQLFFLWNISFPEGVIRFLAGSAHPVRIMYAASLAIVTPTVLLPIYLILRSPRAFRAMQELTDRLSLLASFYLLLDVFGLAVIVIRNLG